MMATLSTLRCVISFSSSSSSSSSVKSNNKNLRVIGRHQKYRTFLRAKRDDEEKNDENSKLPEFEVGSKIVSARASCLHFSKTWRSYHRLRRFFVQHNRACFCETGGDIYFLCSNVYPSLHSVTKRTVD